MLLKIFILNTFLEFKYLVHNKDGIFITVNLDFLLDTHICVFEDVASKGEYLCLNQVINMNEEAVKLAQMLSPDSSQLLQR